MHRRRHERAEWRDGASGLDQHGGDDALEQRAGSL
jgi:hypothetical protein